MHDKTTALHPSSKAALSKALKLDINVKPGGETQLRTPTGREVASTNTTTSRATSSKAAAPRPGAPKLKLDTDVYKPGDAMNAVAHSVGDYWDSPTVKRNELHLNAPGDRQSDADAHADSTAPPSSAGTSRTRRAVEGAAPARPAAPAQQGHQQQRPQTHLESGSGWFRDPRRGRTIHPLALPEFAAPRRRDASAQTVDASGYFPLDEPQRFPVLAAPPCAMAREDAFHYPTQQQQVIARPAGGTGETAAARKEKQPQRGHSSRSSSWGSSASSRSSSSSAGSSSSSSSSGTHHESTTPAGLGSMLSGLQLSGEAAGSASGSGGSSGEKKGDRKTPKKPQLKSKL